jgi:polar amino acid transport system substrate-binding protein
MKRFVNGRMAGWLGAGAFAMFAVSAAAQAETALERIRRTGEIRIGYANEAPFAFTLPDGRVTGESPEIIRALAGKLGAKKVSSVLTEWGGLIPGLQAGRFDLIAAGMYITPERRRQVLFTDPHFQLRDTLLVAHGNPKRLASYADIAANGSTKLAVMAGTAQYGYARQAKIPEARILQVPTTIAQLQAVRTGRADAAAGTQLTMKSLAAKDAKAGGKAVEAIANFKDDPAHTGYGAFAFRKQDQDLRDALNAQLKPWLGSEAHLKLVAPFGFDRSTLTHKTADAIEADHVAPR